ncbi:MAG: diguanylate cyclase domain-containing protein, partial [Microcystaceae cyanobacterium]
NNSLCEFLEATREEIMGKTCLELGVWKNLEDLHRLKTILTEEGVVQNFEIVIRTVLNKTKTVIISAIQVVLGGENCVITVIKDISARKRTEIMLIQAKERAEQAELKLKRTQVFLQKANQQLINLANLDPLTKIANRRCFNTHFKKEWRRLHREQQPLSLILFDVDFFKKFNDCYGHPEGDRCLIKIAQTASKTVGRSTDLVARIGGEEFAVILPNTDLDGAKAIAEKLRSAIQSLNIAHSRSTTNSCVTISLGITSQIPDENNLPETLIDQADQALFLAKDWGRNQFVIFTANST